MARIQQTSRFNGYGSSKIASAIALLMAMAPVSGAAESASSSGQQQKPAAPAKPSAAPAPKPAPPAVKPSSITPVPWTPLLVRTSLTPQPFAGSEGKVHIVYDLIFQNFNSLPVTLGKLELLDADGKVIQAYEERQLAPILMPLGDSPKPFVLPPGSTTAALINLDFNKDADTPELIRHRLTVFANMFDGLKQSTLTYEAAPLVVDKREPVVVGAPLAGGNWLAAGGYAGELEHRRALFAVNNRLQSAQCYAIDWIRLDDAHRSVSGPVGVNENYLAYNQPVFAVADGTISGVIDKFPDQIPNQPSGNDRFDYPEGNAIVEDLGNDLFAMYGHLKPGSLKVKEGQRVKRGQMLAAVGNSGNSSGPHLQMQVMDGPNPIAASGVPYLIDTFKVTGQVKDMRKAETNAASGTGTGTGTGIGTGSPQKVESSPLAGDHKHELPREGTLIVFPDLQTH